MKQHKIRHLSLLIALVLAAVLCRLVRFWSHSIMKIILSLPNTVQCLWLMESLSAMR